MQIQELEAGRCTHRPNSQTAFKKPQYRPLNLGAQLSVASQWLSLPETFCQEDDFSFQYCRGKDLNNLLKMETVQQSTKVHMF